jgi:hypothetical protein
MLECHDFHVTIVISTRQLTAEFSDFDVKLDLSRGKKHNASPRQDHAASATIYTTQTIV